MTRHDMLYEITGIMGDVVAQCEAEGIPLSDRDIRIFADKFCKRYLALPDPPATALANAVLTDEVQHGGLLGRKTVTLAGSIAQERGSDSRHTP